MPGARILLDGDPTKLTEALIDDTEQEYSHSNQKSLVHARSGATMPFRSLGDCARSVREVEEATTWRCAKQEALNSGRGRRRERPSIRRRSSAERPYRGPQS